MAAKESPLYYVLHGKNGFERADYLRLMRSRMGSGAEADLNISEYHFDEGCTAAQVVNDARTMPFLSDRRLVIVHGMLIELGKKAGKDAKADLEKLAAELPHLPDHARLVFNENDDVPTSHPVMKLMQTDSHGFEKLFSLPRNMADWVAKRVIANGAEIEPRAAHMLADLIGADLYSAESEVAKLAAYVNWERPITVDDVDLLTANNVESKIYEIADQIGARRGKQAMGMAQKLVSEGNDPIPILGMIYSHFRKLMIVKSANEDGYNGNLADALGSGGFMVGKLREQATRFSYSELETIHHLLSETDYGIKSGEVKQDLALDLLIATLCT